MIRSRRRVDEVAYVAAQARAAAEKAEAAAQLLRGALAAVPVGLLIVDDGATVYRSERLVPGATHDVEALVEARVRELVATPGDDAAEVVIELHGPPPRRLLLTARPLRERAKVVVVQDASERRQLEAVRRDFVANVSHELRTPVGALLALADAMAGEDDAAVLQRLATRVGGEAERASRMIDSLLALSRIEGDGPRQPTPVAVGSLLADAATEMRDRAGSAGVHVAVSAVEPEVFVVGHRDQLLSALTNLLDNAIKYSERNSRVDLEATTVAGNVRITVKDEGIGIPRADVDRIFERFFRVDRARSRDSGGVGLGLAIVRHIAVNHGGDVAVESTEGVGSEFTLALPETRSG